MKTRYITAKRAREEGERGRPHKQAWHDIDQDQRGVAPILLPLPPALIWVTMMKTDCCFVGRSFAPSWVCVMLLEQLFSPLLKMSQGEIEMTQLRGVSVRDLRPRLPLSDQNIPQFGIMCSRRTAFSYCIELSTQEACVHSASLPAGSGGWSVASRKKPDFLSPPLIISASYAVRLFGDCNEPSMDG